MAKPAPPGPGEVLVGVRAVGICGSDRHHYMEGRCGNSVTRYPAVLGHEAAGEIVALGPGVEGLKPGLTVTIEPALTCGSCEPCRRGRRNLCENLLFMSGRQKPGMLRQWAAMPAENALPAPPGMDFVTAAMAEPLAVALHSIELAQLQMGEGVLVIGAGPIGLLAAAAARLAGAAPVMVADRVPERLAIARQMGVEVAVDGAGKSMREAVMDETSGQGAPVVVDAVGNTASIHAALGSVQRGGRVVIVGISSQPKASLAVWDAMDREIAVHVQKRSNWNTATALQLLSQDRIALDKLVTHRFPLFETGKAFEMLVDYSDGVGKAVVEL